MKASVRASVSELDRERKRETHWLGTICERIVTDTNGSSRGGRSWE